MSYIGLPPKATFSSGLLDRFTSTTGTTVTLTNDIASENDIVVFVNFVKQDSTTYSVGGTGNKTLTLGGTLVSSDIVEVHYLNIVGQTVNPSANSVGSSQLTTDSITGQTAETSIATDDTILIHDTSASALKKMTRANFVSGIGGTNTPAFNAKSATGQSIPNVTHTQVVFGTEVFDTASAFASNVFTVPSGQGGKYFLYAQVQKTNWGANRLLLKIRKGGSTDLAVGEASNATNYYPVANTATVQDLSVGDTIDVTIYHDNGSTQIINDGDSTMFMGYKIIE